MTSRDSGVRAESRGTGSRAPGAGRGDAVRSASRPAAARRGVAGGAAKRTSAPRPRRVTGRATVLFAVLIALALAYTYPVRLYLSQQSDIARMEASQADQRELIGELSAKAAKWRDPAYIRIKARERFFMVYPDEVPVLTYEDPESAAREAAGGAPTAPSQRTPAAWYDTLWSSIQAADAERPTR